MGVVVAAAFSDLLIAVTSNTSHTRSRHASKKHNEIAALEDKVLA